MKTIEDIAKEAVTAAWNKVHGGNRRYPFAVLINGDEEIWKTLIQAIVEVCQTKENTRVFVPDTGELDLLNYYKAQFEKVREQIPKWISVKERLPEESTQENDLDKFWFMIIEKDGAIFKCHRQASDYYDVHGWRRCPTHWMTLLLDQPK